MKKANNTLTKEIEKLARKAGYPHIKLDFYTYFSILKKAREKLAIS